MAPIIGILWVAYGIGAVYYILILIQRKIPFDLLIHMTLEKTCDFSYICNDIIRIRRKTSFQTVSP